MLQKDDVNIYLLDVIKVTTGFFVLLILNCTLEKCLQRNKKGGAKTLMHQSFKWYELSLQDNDIVYALQHCDYALAYLNAARNCESDAIIEKIAGVNVHRYNNKLIKHQMQILKHLPRDKSKGVHFEPSWLT